MQINRPQPATDLADPQAAKSDRSQPGGRLSIPMKIENGKQSQGRNAEEKRQTPPLVARKQGRHELIGFRQFRRFQCERPFLLHLAVPLLGQLLPVMVEKPLGDQMWPGDRRSDCDHIRTRFDHSVDIF